MKVTHLVSVLLISMSFMGCQPSPVGVSVVIKNSTEHNETLQFYTVNSEVLDTFSVAAKSTKEIFVPAKLINDAIAQQGHAVGDLTLKSNTSQSSHLICGYIEVATNKVCGKAKFQINLD
ncbi:MULTISPECIES: hypothetical protein [Pseudoalteromonas]|uniref:Lipoprotein n=1 Tax=Pseudoalteromonas amylolytica TaxID=1859457 RepID=A0A1S1MWI3_9GAMM|nr:MULTISPECIES: hypothetical protein [Pseudoalteromonas]OHU87923.1 hypothetical protein BFC16_10975 [Pseudoalteromonas sp. JW3]OHU91363.1 hypothetical protein BET10_11095 [Pseudoalteromonas amylolytica]